MVGLTEPAEPANKPPDQPVGIGDADTQTPDEQPQPRLSIDTPQPRLSRETIPSRPESIPQVRLTGVHPGDVLGRYELVEEIGEGGMATVYRARDRELRRDVAIKVLFPHLAKRPEVVRRFHREARAAAGLDHPNILKIFDVGGAGGDDDSGTRGTPPFIVMELVRGRSLLAEIEQRGAVLAEIVAAIGALLADALAAAHAASIVHRDVKPANVLIAQGGRVLLADFGVARLETEDSLITRTGAVLGTPAYMAPEQATGDTATARSDVYSLGVTLYQLATGTLPYSGGPARVLAQLSAGQVTPAVRRRPAVGAELSRTLERLMARDPDHRPSAAAAAASELRALARAGGIGEPRDEVAAYFTDADGYVRAKTPAVVSALVTASRAAIHEHRLPRAMALADRASALASDDPAVVELVAAVTAGDRGSRRRRGLLVAGGVAIVAVAAVAGHAVVGGQGGEVAAVVAVDAASPLLVAIDAGVVVVPPLDASEPVITVDAATRVVAVDARVHHVVEAAPIAAGPVDAAEPAAAPPDATAAPPADAPQRPSAIVVVNDTWCEITIDGAKRGQLGRTPYEVAPGPHTVTCAQSSTNRSWTESVDVGPGETKTVKGAMLVAFTVTVGVGDGATIDGAFYPSGASHSFKVGRYKVEAGKLSQYLDLWRACTLRVHPADDGTPRLDCDP